jgi:hypothetical protein
MDENRAMSSPTPPSSGPASPVEQLTAGITREWILDRRIVIYAGINLSRAAIDSWYEAFKADIMAWPVDRPYLVVHDLTHKNVALTPYARKRAQDMVYLRPDVKGRSALIMRNTFASHLIDMFLRQQRNTPRERRVFYTREKAIEWLKTCL